MAVEEAKYSVMLKDDKFELRKYEPHILAETIVDGDFEDAGSAAFNRLFKYISGKNKRQQKVAMTSPVGQYPSSRKIKMTSPVSQKEHDGKWVVSFMMPASFTLETTPEPLDSSVELRQVPARYIAAVRYSGFWSLKNYNRNLEKLKGWIKEKGYRPIGEPIWARYNPPFMPWFLRRNEILVPVEPPDRY
ncbi:MAG: heme-binding protein [Campylobacterales bacterium]